MPGPFVPSAVTAAILAGLGAILDTDFSGNEGFMRKTGPGAYETIKTNLSAVADPVDTDDSAAGYAVGSRWVNVSAGTEWVCVDSTPTAAVWVETTGGGGGAPDNVVYLDETGSAGGETTFAAAVAAANALGAAATILVYPGTYTIPATQTFTVDVSIVGTGPEECIFTVDHASLTNIVAGGDLAISGVTIQGDGVGTHGSLNYILGTVGSRVILHNVVVDANSRALATWVNSGIMLISDCRFINPGSSPVSGQFLLSVDDDVTVSNCYIEQGCSAAAVLFQARSGTTEAFCTITNCQLVATAASGAISGGRSGTHYVISNCLIDNFDLTHRDIGASDQQLVTYSNCFYIGATASGLIEDQFSTANSQFCFTGGNLLEAMGRPAFGTNTNGTRTCDRGFTQSVTAATAIVLAWDDRIDCNRAGTIALTLPPSASHCTGRITIHDIGDNASTTNIISLVASGGDTINGSIQTIEVAGGSLYLVRNAAKTGWNVVSSPAGQTDVISSTTLDVDATGAIQINSTGGAISVGNDADAQDINVGTGAAARTITVGNTTGATAVNLDSGSGGININSGVVSHADGTSELIKGNATGTGQVTRRIGLTVTEGFEERVYEETISPVAVQTNAINVPAGAVILGVQTNVETALTAGGTSVTLSIGTAGTPDKYGTHGSDSLAQNQKIDTMPDWAVLGASEQIVLTAAVSGGATAGDTAFSAGSVRVRVVYLALNSLDDA